MSREYPDWVDPWKAADGRREFAGSIPLSRMQRLAPLLVNAEGEAEFSAAFGYDRQRRVTIAIAVHANLALICQASLEPYSEPVRRSSLLGVIEKLAEENLLPADYEPVMVENRRLPLVQIVEDELLLGLPQVPRNPRMDPDTEEKIRQLSGQKDQASTKVESEFGEPTRKPFADLAEQIKKQSRLSGKDS